jgi:hypothetical protein
VVLPVFPKLPVPGGFPRRCRASANSAQTNDGSLLCSWPMSTNESWPTLNGSRPPVEARLRYGPALPAILVKEPCRRTAVAGAARLDRVGWPKEYPYTLSARRPENRAGNIELCSTRGAMGPRGWLTLYHAWRGNPQPRTPAFSQRERIRLASPIRTERQPPRASAWACPGSPKRS